MSHLSHQQNQIRCEPEVCVNESEFLVPKKRNKSRFSSFAQVLALFSLISLAPTAMSVEWDTLVEWTKEVAVLTSQVPSSELSDKHVKQFVYQIFQSGGYSLTASDIKSLKKIFEDELERLGVSGHLADQAADWFESALDRFTAP